MRACREGPGSPVGRRAEVRNEHQAEELPDAHSFPTTRPCNVHPFAQKWYCFDGLVQNHALAISRSSRGMHTQAMK